MQSEFRLESVDSIDEIYVPRRVPRIERVPVVADVTGMVMCDRLFKLPTHFNGRRTVLCPGKSECDLHKTCALRVYFLCAIYESDQRELTWYQLPANAAKALLLGVKTLDRPLFGINVRVGRKWKDKNAPVTLSIDPYARPGTDHLKPVSPEESVKRCFFSTSEKPFTYRKKAV